MEAAVSCLMVMVIKVEEEVRKENGTPEFARVCRMCENKQDRADGKKSGDAFMTAMRGILGARGCIACGEFGGGSRCHHEPRNCSRASCHVPLRPAKDTKDTIDRRQETRRGPHQAVSI